MTKVIRVADLITACSTLIPHATERACMASLDVVKLQWKNAETSLIVREKWKLRCLAGIWKSAFLEVDVKCPRVRENFNWHFTGSHCGSQEKLELFQSSIVSAGCCLNIPSGKLTWQWKMDHFKMYISY